MLYSIGLSGIPITNVNNNCSTGSTALYHANALVRGGLAECALALGFERMARGSLGTNFPDRVPPMAPFHTTMDRIEQAGLGVNHGPGAPRMSLYYLRRHNMLSVQQLGTTDVSSQLSCLDTVYLAEYTLQIRTVCVVVYAPLNSVSHRGPSHRKVTPETADRR